MGKAMSFIFGLKGMGLGAMIHFSKERIRPYRKADI